MPTQCPAPDLVARYLDDRLPDEESTSLEAHLSTCPRCEGRLRLALKGDPLLPLARGGGTAWAVPPPLRERLLGLCAAPDTSGTRAQETPPVVGPTGAPELVGLLRPAQAPDELGRVGQYRILKVLGKGGMGVVCLAQHLHLGNRVAVKLIRPGMAADPRAVAFFVRESRAVAALSHEHVVTVYDGGQDGDVLFLAMELLEGQTVASWMAETPRRRLGEVLRTAREAATGLAFAHSKGVVHRDFKPANLWRCADRGRIKLLDFGLARDSNGSTLTEPGQVYGTLPYMSPEQAQGKPCDARSDLFSLGVVLHELCSDVSPFARPHQLNVLTALVEYHPDPLDTLYPWLPADLVALTRDLLTKDPAARVPSANEVVERLRHIEGEAERGGLLDRLVGQPEAEAVPAETPSGPVPIATTPVRPRPARAPRKRWPLAAGLAFGLVLAAGIGVAMFAGGNRDDKKGEEPKKTEKDEKKDKPDEKTGEPPAATPVKRDPNVPPPPKAGEPVSPLAMTKAPTKFANDWTWTLETTQTRKSVQAVACQPKGGLIAVGSSEGTVRLYDAKSGKFHKALVAAGDVQELNWLPDGSHLIVTTWNPKSKSAVWNVESGAVVREIGVYLERPQVSPDGRWLAGTFERGRVYVFDLTTDAKPLDLVLPNTTPTVVAWHPKSTQLLVGYRDGQVRFWDTTKPKPDVAKEFDSKIDVMGLAWFEEQRLVVSGVHAFIIREGGRTMRPEVHRPAQATTVLASPDGKHFADVGGNVFRVVDGTKGDVKVTLGGVIIAAWAPGGAELATATSKNEIQFVDRTGKPLLKLPPFDDGLAISAEKGYFVPPAKGDNPFVFVVQHKDGQKTYTPEEFEKLTGGKWKNDPDSLK